MEKPTITIGGRKIEMPVKKARIWREVIKLDEELKDKTIAAVDYVDRHCEFIALVFGVTVDEVLDNLDLEEVLPLYNEIVKEIVATLYKGFGEVKKNEAAEQT